MNERNRKLMVILHLRTAAGRRHLSGILDYADGKPNWEIMLFEPNQLTDIHRFKRLLTKERIDGVILTLPLAPSLMTYLIHSKLAIVFDNIPNVKLPSGRRHVSFVYTDNEDVGRKAGEYLLSLGKFNAFGFINHPTDEFWSRERERAFRSCVEKHAPFFSFVGEPLDKWLLELPKPAGIMTAGDDHSIPIISTCRKCGIDIPRQIAVISSGIVSDSAKGNNATLSSIAPDMHNLGYHAAREMDRLLRQGKNSATREIVIAAEDIAVRSSSEHMLPAAQLVANIKSFIATHFHEDIFVDDILASTKCSRRLAELRFRQIEGTSIRKALEAVRLKEAMRLLRTTEDSATQIARRCGLKSIDRLSRLFARETGQTIRKTRHIFTNRT